MAFAELNANGLLRSIELANNPALYLYKCTIENDIISIIEN